MKCILVRHGQTDWNNKRMTQGQSDTILNKIGIIQAKKVAKTLEKEHIGLCYFSPLKRAKTTAEIITEHLNIDSKEDEALIEINFGLWEGMTIKQISEQYEDAFKDWTYSPHKLVIPEGEDMHEAMRRSEMFINKEILKSDKNILIVSHGLLIKTLIISLLGLDLKDLQKFRVDNASISVIEIKGDRRYLSKLNDTSHLDRRI